MIITVTCRITNADEQELVGDAAKPQKKKLMIDLSDVKYFHEGFEEKTLFVYMEGGQTFIIEYSFKNFYDKMIESIEEDWNNGNGIWISFSKN